MPFVLYGICVAVGIVEEVQRIAAKSFPQQSATGIIVSVLNSVDHLTGSQTVGIIGIADGIRSIAGICEPSALRPCECPPCAVVVAGGIAHGIVSDALTVNRSQQVLPVGVTIGITVPVGSLDFLLGSSEN